MGDRSEENRRFPRVRARCRVELRDRYGTWTGETEDVGPRGCRIVTPRPQTVGTLVRLTLESELAPAALEVTGQIVWVSAERPPRAGISFAGSASSPGALAPGAWFDALARAAPGDPVAFARGGSGAPPPAPPPGTVLVPPPPPGVALVPPPPLVEAAPPGSLAARLAERAGELAGAGQAAQAEMLLARALELAPGDAALEATLARLRATRPPPER